MVFININYYQHYIIIIIIMIIGSHIQIVCISTQFEGKNTLARQRMIYKAIWDEMSGPVHACDSIVAKTPQEMSQ